LKGSGDVKYHKGFSADIRTPGGNVHVVLAFNPSHLEVVNPVVEGSARARQERRDDAIGDKVVPIVIHGDSAFGGQGVVMETFQLSQARGFYTGGTVHLVINNQVGFTTSDPRDTRSTLYCSDVAKMVEAPIFHVNGDDPEAVVFTARLALAYRMKFHKDVVIDLVCYRRHGHNEADEPAATQPVMYQVIRKHPTPRQLYAQQLESLGVLAAGAADAMVAEYRKGLDEGKPQARAALGLIGNKYTVDWTPFLDADPNAMPLTGVPLVDLKRLGARLTHVPSDFTLHPRVAKIIDDRRKMYAGEQALDWGAAEMLGYATLLDQGYPIRLVGQDAGRGTFFHRHAVLHDQATANTFVSLAKLADRQPKFTVIDSVLSEEAVLGFEYGFSTTDPTQLVIWEGQFGDFANGAQVIIDQFICSSEDKWRRLTSVVLLLPHGFEGQGPEHSSARLERFLGLCAQDNMRVVNLTTPAQLFHCLRRQAHWKLRKPLVIVTPKSLLRHPEVISPWSEFSHGSFQPVIPDIAPVDVVDPKGVKRIILCTGKVYYDLKQRRQDTGAHNVAIVRLEQLYPLRLDAIERVLAPYPEGTPVVWVQEEPWNMGAWPFLRLHLGERLLARHPLQGVTRNESASPATGSAASHKMEQSLLLDRAFDIA
jgi:2-oxoglutarate dehydrogenase E1 component